MTRSKASISMPDRKGPPVGNIFSDCEACPLAGEGLVRPFLSLGARLAFLGGSPPRSEVGGFAFPEGGEAGRILDGIAAAVGIDPGDYIKTYVAKCYVDGRLKAEQTRACGSMWLSRELRFAQPRAVVVFGKLAADYLGQKIWSEFKGKGYISCYWSPHSTFVFPMTDVHDFVSDRDSHPEFRDETKRLISHLKFYLSLGADPLADQVFGKNRNG